MTVPDETPTTSEPTAAELEWLSGLLAAEPVPDMPEQIFARIEAALQIEQQHRAAADDFAPVALPTQLDESLDVEAPGALEAPAHFERPGLDIAEKIW